MEKRLKPSLKENKRYLLLETSANRKDIKKAIIDYLGILGYAKAGVYFVSDKIIAVNRKQVNNVRAALCVYNKLIKVKKVSGSLKKLKIVKM